MPKKDKPPLLSARALLVIAAFFVLAGIKVNDWVQERNAKAEAKRVEALPPQYGAWDDRLHTDIIRVMGKSGFAGHWAQCGVMRFKTDFIHPGRFLVRCSDVGKDWSEYRVDTNSSMVRGPYEPSREND